MPSADDPRPAPRGAPTLSLTLPSFGLMYTGGEWRRLLDLARAADDAGIDRLLLTDHVVMSRATDRYPFGTFPFGPDAPWLEPLSTLSAMAAVTNRVRMSTKILIAPLRPAPLLAKTLATMDVLSGGRMEVGVGTGWQREEYDAAGLDWDARGRLLTDTVAACRALWASSPASFSSASFSFRDIWCEPRPLQPGGIPVWFSGSLHRRNIDRITRLGSGWIPPPYGKPADLAEPVRTLRAAWESAGRDPGGLHVQGDIEPVLDERGRPDPVASVRTAHEWIDAGATTINVVLLHFAGRHDRALELVPRLSQAWRDVLAERGRR
jgi:probable F420-dependent oxidoreductase